LTLRSGPTELLRDVSFSVPRGKVCAIVSPLAAGKSALLHAIAGGARPASGQVTLFDRPIDAWSRRELSRRCAHLSQETPSALPFTTLEVALLGRGPQVGVRSQPHDVAIARRALAVMALAELEGKPYSKLTKGEREPSSRARSRRSTVRRTRGPECSCSMSPCRRSARTAASGR
jgi:iron complex transport system ATP-binding protein